ncbi:septum formation inhibitor Maf [Rossellomorea marisflavi]|uniref:dTTP/UTP pyrophosphatase n=1 Tax=Rossellomorea marisflavi TaxID=189381 RepID=A0A5D4S1Y0_9BACI|nr:Maf family protein [Rossellomorea marisflavi]TYS56949.1 septum formation inhibitor Maf [Rossellomorea marisflavi]
MSSLILASQSPRRKELLKQIQLSFTTLSPQVEETFEEGMLPGDVVMYLADIKAAAVSGEHPDSFVIGSDTVVTKDGKILGKPKDEDDARAMLTELSGSTHDVYTGVSIHHRREVNRFYERTTVTFWELSPSEIDGYIASGEPFDKAGAYGIQGIGAKFVKGIEGDYYAVVGLPVSRVNRTLAEMGYRA